MSNQNLLQKSIQRNFDFSNYANVSKPATYQGKYFLICKNCPNGHNKTSKIGRYLKYRRNGDYVIQLKANQINKFKKAHDPALNHRWTILHESVVPKYVHTQMIGDKECLVVTV